jgi:peptide/nickel transport system permease protein
MITFVIRRILQMIIVLFVVTILVFLMVRILPGDPILLFLTRGEQQGVTQEQIDYMRHDLGLDRPMIVQYVDWFGHAIWGRMSIVDTKPLHDASNPE